MYLLYSSRLLSNLKLVEEYYISYFYLFLVFSHMYFGGLLLY